MSRDKADIWRVSVILLLHLVYQAAAACRRRSEVFVVLKWVRDCEIAGQSVAFENVQNRPPTWILELEVQPEFNSGAGIDTSWSRQA